MKNEMKPRVIETVAENIHASNCSTELYAVRVESIGYALVVEIPKGEGPEVKRLKKENAILKARLKVIESVINRPLPDGLEE